MSCFKIKIVNLCPDDVTFLPELWEAWEGRETCKALMSPLGFSALGSATAGVGQGGAASPGGGSWEKPDRRPAPGDLWARAAEAEQGACWEFGSRLPALTFTSH